MTEHFRRYMPDHALIWTLLGVTAPGDPKSCDPGHCNCSGIDDTLLASRRKYIAEMRFDHADSPCVRKLEIEL